LLDFGGHEGTFSRRSGRLFDLIADILYDSLIGTPFPDIMDDFLFEPDFLL
jgi:hypothetical protein